MVKMLLKEEVGGHAFNDKIVMEITLLIMENHGIVFLNFCGEGKHTRVNVLNF